MRLKIDCPALGQIQVFSRGGSMKGGRRRRPPCMGASFPGKFFEISNPQKRDFRHSEAKSACFNIFFFLSGNGILFAQSCVETMQISIYKTVIKMYCILSFFNFVSSSKADQQEAFFGGIFPQKSKPQHRSQRAFRSECS